MAQPPPPGAGVPEDEVSVSPWGAQGGSPLRQAGHPIGDSPPPLPAPVGRGSRICPAGAAFGPLCLTRYLFSPICST